MNRQHLSADDLALVAAGTQRPIMTHAPSADASLELVTT